MESMKLFFTSLGMGLLVPAFLVVLMLTLKLLLPGTTSGNFVLWFFFWPLPFLLRLFQGLASETAMFLAFAVGTVVDIAFFSFLGYWGLRTIQRAKRTRVRSTVPPQPPTF
jgi:hypothetical protein